VDSVTGNTEMIPCPESFFTCPCIYVIYKMSVLGDWVDSHLFTIFSKYVILGLINPCKISSQRLFWLRLVKDVRMFYYLHVASCEVNKCYIHCALRGEYNVLSKVVSRDVSQVNVNIDFSFIRPYLSRILVAESFIVSQFT
jgi:hypothetical protein